MVTSHHDDLLASEVIDDPYPYLARLRETDPVHWNDVHQAWIITRYDDFVWITRQPNLFSSEVAKRSPPEPREAADRELHEKARDVQANSMAQKDRDEHASMRKAVNAFFTPTAVERWRPRIR